MKLYRTPEDDTSYRLPGTVLMQINEAASASGYRTVLKPVVVGKG